MSDARDLIADSIHRILGSAVDRAVLEQAERGEWPGALWSLVQDNGFDRVLDAEGAATDWRDAEPVLFALGYHRAPVPLAEALVARWLGARAGLALDDGPATVVEGEALQFARRAEALAISGHARRVPWARHAQALVVSGTLDGRAVLAVVPRQGCQVAPAQNVAGEPRDDVRFDDVQAEAWAFVPALPRRPVRLYGALAHAVAMAGAAASVLDQSVQYVNDRRQFGRSLAKFQAVQHLLAEMGSEAAAGATAASAACAVVGGAGEELDIAVAKVRAGQMAAQVSRAAHQVHGAMGFTHEYLLHFGTRRLWAWRQEFGGDAAWAQELGARAMATGGERFWSDIMVGAK